MVKVKDKLFILCAVIMASLIYSKVLPVPMDRLYSVIPSGKFKILEGIIVSNPVKVNPKFYSLKIKPVQVMSVQNQKASCSGKVTVLIPSEIVEAYYPEKIFSKMKNSKKGFLIEKGSKINLEVLNKGESNTFFICKNIRFAGFNYTFSDRLNYFRGVYRLQFKRLMSLWGKAGGLVLALLSGSKEYLDGNMVNAFKLSGLSHILALSGMHLSIISTLTGTFEKYSILKKTGLVFQYIIIALFVFFAGLSPSLLRALISFSIVILSRLLNVRIKNGLHLISITFLIHISISPADVYNLGFIFSYGALCGILIFSSLINSLLIRFIPGRILKSLSSSIGANICTAPVSLMNFGFYSPQGIICTLFVSPVITVFLYSALLIMFISLFFPVFTVYGCRFMNILYLIIEWIVKVFKIIPVIQIF